MTYEMMLAFKMACAGTTHRELREEHFAAIIDSYASTRQESVNAADIVREIDETVTNDENFEAGENKPTANAIGRLKQIIVQAEQSGAEFLPEEVSTFYGDVNVTWERDNRLVRLITHSDDRDPEIYSYTDLGRPLNEGAVEPATAEALRDKLVWLNEA